MTAEEAWTARRRRVQPRHRNNPQTLSRWSWMLAAPSRDWSVFQQIFADHWDTFQRAHPRYQTAYDDSLVAKMLACGHPEQMRLPRIPLPALWSGHAPVAMSCKSSLCLRCAKVYADNWVDQVSKSSMRASSSAYYPDGAGHVPHAPSTRTPRSC